MAKVGRMSGLEYGKPLDQYVPICEKCHEGRFALCPITMSEFVAENWKERMNRVLPDLRLHCTNCGTAVLVGNLKFRRM